MPLSRYQKANIFRGVLLAIGLGYLAYDFYLKGKYTLILVIVMGGIALGVAMVQGKRKE
jgi:hypothetical protein